MKFSVGYQLRKDSSLVDSVLENKDKIREIYFSWENFPNGRNCSLQQNELDCYEARKKQRDDFKLLFDGGISFNLLLNGNCYGKYAQSRAFFCKVGDAVEYLKEEYGLSSVTTTSPLIAKFLKQNFPDTEVRASVNMEIGSVQGMDYISDLFDSFYLKREYNRDIGKIKEISKWCVQNGKRLYGLANSGCLNKCSAHIFHDNLVAHEAEISEMDNAYQFEGQCRKYLEAADKRNNWLRITNFIRPEDIRLYEGLFDGIKLATRVNANPSRIVRAYTSGGYSGSVPALLEPDHSGLFYPFVIENKRIPEDFAKRVAECNKNCEACNYCNEVLQQALIALE